MPADFPAAQLVTPEALFKSSDGLEIHGQLFKTAGGPAKRPALIYVHGGPPRQMLLGWHYMGYYANDYGVNQYLASRGFIVLSVNYRLGIGYGHAFHHPEHAGARGASEYLDVLAGAKYLQARPDVDASRLGIWGGSYGGYLTALALGRNSDIFAAGVDIHGVHNWDRQVAAPNFSAALAGDGISEATMYKRGPRGLRVVAGLRGDDVEVAGAAHSRRRRPERGVPSDGGSQAAAAREGRHGRRARHPRRHPRLPALAHVAHRRGATTAYLEKRLLKVSTSAN